MPDEVKSPTYDFKETVYLPPQLVPISSSISDEAKAWLTRVYKEAYVGDGSEMVAANLFNFIENTRVQFQTIENDILKLREIATSRDVVSDIEINLFKPVSGSALVPSDLTILYLNDVESLLGASIKSAAIYLSTVFGFTVVVPERVGLKKLSEGDEINRLFSIYEWLLRTSQEKKVAILDEGRGASLAASLVIKAFQEDKEMPVCLGLIGVDGPLGDSYFQNYFLDVTNLDLVSKKIMLGEGLGNDEVYDGVERNKNPLYFPHNANMQIFPPAILISGARDTNYSSTVLFHRKLRRSKIEAELHVFDGLPRLFHYVIDLPESAQVYKQLAGFFKRFCGQSSKLT